MRLRREKSRNETKLYHGQESSASCICILPSSITASLPPFSPLLVSRHFAQVLGGSLTAQKPPQERGWRISSVTKTKLDLSSKSIWFIPRMFSLSPTMNAVSIAFWRQSKVPICKKPTSSTPPMTFGDRRRDTTWLWIPCVPRAKPHLRSSYWGIKDPRIWSPRAYFRVLHHNLLHYQHFKSSTPLH